MLRIGQPSAALQAVHKRHGVECCAFLTAWNPLSEQLEHEANMRRQEDLAVDMARRSLGVLPAIGVHPGGQWPGEVSFLVLGLKLEAGKVLGGSLEQSAFVWSGADCVPRLVLLR